MIGQDSENKVQKILITLIGLALPLICLAQQDMTPPPWVSDARPVPVLSGYAAFVPTWDSGSPTLISIVSPVLLVPLSSNLVFESRGAFEGDFRRRNGTSGDFTGAIQKSLVMPRSTTLATRM